MNKIVLALTLTMAVTLVGCSTVSSKKQSHQKSKPDVKTVLLQCNKASTSTGYSFVTGKPTSRREADINLYFDGDDCSQGVVFGSDDEEGYIFVTIQVVVPKSVRMPLSQRLNEYPPTQVLDGYATSPKRCLAPTGQG